VRDDGIRLGQLLKLADLAESGTDAKALLLEGLVQVNGEVETRRGRQLARGDVVQVGDQVTRLV
jgi:ribosome-associated protein